MDVKGADVNEANEVKESEEKTKVGEKRSPRRRAAMFVKEVFFGFLYAVWGYFLGGLSLPFGAMPFGIALLSASDRKVFYIYAGLCVAAWGGRDKFVFIGIYTALILVRLASRLLIDPPWGRNGGAAAGERTVAEFYPHLFSENLALRMATSAVGAFAMGGYRIIEGGATYYDLYGTVISVLAAPSAVLLVSGFFLKSTSKYRKLVSFLALAFGVAYAVGDRKLYGISLAVAGCMFVTLYVTKKGGTVLGVLSGALLGLAVSLEYVPLFAFAGLVAGLLFPMSVTLGAAGALSVTIAWGVYVQGIGILNGTASALVSSALIFTVFDKLFMTPKTADTRDETTVPTADTVFIDFFEKELSDARLSDVKRSIESVGESFESMSEALYGISRHMQTPASADVKQICDNAFDDSCASCQHKSLCWSERYRETSEAVNSLCETLLREGSVRMDEADENLIGRCPRLPDILSEINHNTFLHTQRILEGDRTEVFALDYSAVSEFMRDTVTTEDAEYEPDRTKSAELLAELRERDFGVADLCVFGTRRKRISVLFSSRELLEKNRDRVTESISALLGITFACDEPCGEEKVLRLAESEKFSVSCAGKNHFAEGEEEYCGDTSGIFRSRDGKLYSFISDGMGSGREAALTSGMVGIFLRKFLAGGASPENTLALLNGFLRSRGGGSLHECSSTVDLMVLDLICGRACFYKCGAAPTYVFRNGGLFKLRSHTVPVGILKELDLRKLDLEVDRGDVIIMVSDGVTDGKEECPWLFDLLRSRGDGATPERLAELIVKYAKAEGAGDDISVLVVKIQ